MDDAPLDSGRTQRLHLQRYRTLHPGKQFFSLSQNPASVPRTEDANGLLMTLTTNVQLWLLR